MRFKLGDIHSVIDRAVAAHMCAFGTSDPTVPRRGSLIPVRRISKRPDAPKKVQKDPVSLRMEPEFLEAMPGPQPGRARLDAVELLGLTAAESVELGPARQATAAVVWSNGGPVVTLDHFDWWSSPL